ncbi:MAG: DNA-3-methyladenine glycosylase, partial [Proteobacteria bacterium]
FIGGPICETEAYDQDEEASHTFRGPNERNASMFKEPGTIYIYRSYGIHWCMNISTGSKGRGEGVLLRAMHATFGAEEMLAGASNSPERICSGPGRLCAALRIDKRFDGMMIGIEGISIWKTELKETYETVMGARIGISKALELNWRFGIKDHPSLSKPFPREKSLAKTKKRRS